MSLHRYMQRVPMQQGEGDLQQLDISSNQLQAILPIHTAPLSSLRTLVASRNALSDVSGMRQLTRLRVLDLARNRLTTLQQLHVSAHAQWHHTYMHIQINHTP